MYRRAIYISTAVVALIAAIFVWRVYAASSATLAEKHPLPSNPLGVAVSQSTAGEGQRLARLNGCFTCHGPNLAGHVMFAGILGSRLTSGNLTRITQRQTDDQIAAAMRYGVRPNGTALFDMPSADLIKLSDGDVASIIGYLHTLKPQPDGGAPTQWNLDGRSMLAMGFFQNAPTLVDPSQRGPQQTPTKTMALARYVAITQCSACHAPDLNGDDQLKTPDLHKAVKHYTLAQFQHFFATGEAPKDRDDTSVMTHVIQTALKYLTPHETAALYAYLNDQNANH